MAAEGARPISSRTGKAGPTEDRPSGGLSTGPPRITPLREMQLVEAHRKGDPTALAELLHAYQRRVYAVCYRMLRNPEEAADLSQDALVKVLEGLHSYDGRSKLSTWIIRIAMNCCLSHLRKQKLRKHASLDGVLDRGQEHSSEANQRTNLWLGREHSAHDRVEQEELRSILRSAMMTLDPEARAILVLRDMQSLEYEQVSEVLDIPLGTVKSRLFRARAALRAAVEAAASEPPHPRGGSSPSKPPHLGGG